MSTEQPLKEVFDTAPVQEKTTLDKYMDELRDDTKLDEFTVKDVQMRLPGLKHKWVGRLMRTKASIHYLNREKEQLRKKLVEHVKKSAPVTVSNPTIERAVESLQEMQDLSSKIQETHILVEFLEKVEKIFSSMTYDIKNLVEILKLEQL